jgi:8-oxo-dGTP pyrophosphatase MutT (NUDIX family)
MNSFWQRVGTLAGWLAWPASWLYLRFSTRTRVLVISRDKVLVVKNWLGDRKWSLPGGGLHRSEPPVMGALREVREETGVMLAPEQLSELFHGRYHDRGFRFECFFFMAHCAEPLVPKRQKGEIIASEWVAVQNLTAVNAGNDVMRALAAWHQQV